MEIDRDLLKKLSEADDETLRAAVKDIAAALGADERQTARAVQNIGRYKHKLTKMSDGDIKRAIDKVSPEKLDEIMKNLKL